MTDKFIVIIFFQEKAYVPRQARIESGLFLNIEPVHVAAQRTDDLTQTIKEVLSQPVPLVPDPDYTEIRQNDPVLRATAARNWKELARKGASYAISILSDKIEVDVSRTNKKGVWEFDPDRVKVFEAGTSLQTIVEWILADLRSRSDASIIETA